MSCLVLSCLVLSCLVSCLVLYLVLSCLVSSRLVSSCLVSPYLTSPHLTSPLSYLTLYLTLPYTLPYLTLPYLTLPYLTLPYLTLPYLTLPYLTLPYLTLPYLTLPYLTLPHLTSPQIPPLHLTSTSLNFPLVSPKEEAIRGKLYAGTDINTGYGGVSLTGASLAVLNMLPYIHAFDTKTGMPYVCDPNKKKPDEKIDNRWKMIVHPCPDFKKCLFPWNEGSWVLVGWLAVCLFHCINNYYHVALKIFQMWTVLVTRKKTQ